jgi:hypothetical protein
MAISASNNILAGYECLPLRRWLLLSKSRNRARLAEFGGELRGLDQRGRLPWFKIDLQRCNSLRTNN